MAVGDHHVVELSAGGPDDSDGARAAAVLGAYCHVEHTRAFRRLLWHRLAILAIAWALCGSLTPMVSSIAVAVGFVLFAAVAIAAAVVEWRASETLKGLLKIH